MAHKKMKACICIYAYSDLDLSEVWTLYWTNLFGSAHVLRERNEHDSPYGGIPNHGNIIVVVYYRKEIKGKEKNHVSFP